MISRKPTLPCSYVKCICYVYFYASSLMNTCQEVEIKRDFFFFFAGTFHKDHPSFLFSFFFAKGQTDLTTVSEIGIVIVHFVYFKNKIGIL